MKVKMLRPDGKEVSVFIETYSRGGTMSPELDIIIYKGKRITPFQARRDGWKYTLNSLFVKTYSEALADLISFENPFLKMIPKDNTYDQPVILGLEHGVKFDV